MAPKRAAAADPPSGTEEDGDTSSGDSTTSHEQEVADEERRENESSPEESESESEEEESAAAAAEDEQSTEEGVEEVEDEQSTDEGEAEPHPQPSSKRVDPPVIGALKVEVQEGVDLQPSKRVDQRRPRAAVLPAKLEVADEERRGKESSPEESESESGEDESAAAEEVEVEEEEDEQSMDEGEAEPHPQPSSKRVDSPLIAALKEEVQEGVDLQPSRRADPRAPVAKKQPQSNNSPARDRKRACCEIGKTASCEIGKTAQHSYQTKPRLKRARRTWAPGDEVLVLKALAQHRREHGELPIWGDCGFFESIRECLEDDSFHHFDVKDKARSLLHRYRSRVVPTTDHDSLIHSLSRDVWGDLPPIVDYATAGSINGNEEADDMAAVSSAENGGGRSDTKGFKKMCERYPLLAREVKLLAEVQPSHESAFTRLDAERALYMEKKLERVKYEELKFETRMVLEVHAPKAKITKKLVSLLAKVSKDV
jgi:hypothetical protein